MDGISASRAPLFRPVCPSSPTCPLRLSILGLLVAPAADCRWVPRGRDIDQIVADSGTASRRPNHSTTTAPLHKVPTSHKPSLTDPPTLSRQTSEQSAGKARSSRVTVSSLAGLTCTKQTFAVLPPSFAVACDSALLCPPPPRPLTSLVHLAAITDRFENAALLVTDSSETDSVVEHQVG